jgi:tellurite resistance protein TerC
MPTELLFISGFLLFIFIMLAIDLGLFSNSKKPVSLKQAGIMSAVWIALALGFYLLLLNYGHLLHNINTFAQLQQVNINNFHQLQLNPNDLAGDMNLYRKNLGVEFITGYVVEYALSVDNIFVMVLIFTAFSVDPKYYHKVLLWGIIGAVAMRFAFIFAGSALIIKFHWILYLFGAFLVYTGVMMYVERNHVKK